MAAGSAEIHFAKKLANNEKKIRDKAVRKLRAWLASRPQHGPGFKEVDLLKIWKGLFYCMWMSDKPLVQEELAENISQLIHSLKNLDSAVLFIKTFFKTMNREWHGIDRLRMDKFYLLIRKFINNSFQLARNNDWDESLVKLLMEVYCTGPLSPASQTVLDGIRLHFCTVYLPELETVAGAELPPEVVLKFLDPLLILAAETKSKVVSRAIKENVMDYLVTQRETLLSSEIDVEKEEEEVNDDGDEDHQSLQIDYSRLVERLLALASDRGILGRNRNQLYQYAKRFKSLSGGTTLVENWEKLTEPVAVSAPVDEDGDADNNVQEHEGSKKKKKRKKRKSDSSDEVLSKRHKSQPEGDDSDNFKTQELQQKPQAVEDKSGKLGKKNKKKRDSMTPSSEMLTTTVCTSRENTATSVQQDTNLEAISTQEEHSDIGRPVNKVSTDVNTNAKENETRQTLITSENMLNGHSSQILGKKENTTASKKTKHTKTSCKRSSDTLIDSSFNNTSTEIHSSNASLNGFEETIDDLIEDDAKAESPHRGKKARTKHMDAGDKPFAVFQKVKATPPAFVKKAVSKITPKTGPTKHKVLSAAVGACPKSDPTGLAKKRVRIALNKNTAHTTHDYRKSLTESPLVPFDALRTPTHGLLKSAPSTTPRKGSSAIRSSQRKKPPVLKRPSASDFF